MTEGTVVIDHIEACLDHDHEDACRDPWEAWEGDPEGSRPVVVARTRVLTNRPTEEQVAVLLRFGKFEQNTRGDAHKQAAMINRVPLLMQALCTHFDDWSDLEDRLALAEGDPDRVSWQDITQMLGDIIRVHMGEDANREQRRAAAKRPKRARRASA